MVPKHDFPLQYVYIFLNEFVLAQNRGVLGHPSCHNLFFFLFWREREREREGDREKECVCVCVCVCVSRSRYRI